MVADVLVKLVYCIVVGSRAIPAKLAQHPVNKRPRLRNLATRGRLRPHEAWATSI